MTFDELITPIYNDFKRSKEEIFVDSSFYKDAERVAFYRAMKKYIEILSSDAVLSHHEYSVGGDEIVQSMEEKRGFEIGAAINSNPRVYSSESSSTFFGRKLSKTVYCLVTKPYLKGPNETNK